LRLFKCPKTVHYRQRARGTEDQSITELFIGAKYQQRPGALVGDLHRGAGNPVAQGFSGLGHGQQITFRQAVTVALVQYHHVEYADLSDATGHVDDSPGNGLCRCFERQVCQVGRRLRAEQAVSRTYFLSDSQHCKGGDVTRRDEANGTDIIHVDSQHFLALGIRVGRTAPEHLVGGLRRVQGAPRINTLAIGTEYPSGIGGDNVRSVFKFLGGIEDPVVQ